MQGGGWCQKSFFLQISVDEEDYKHPSEMEMFLNTKSRNIFRFLSLKIVLKI